MTNCVTRVVTLSQRAESELPSPALETSSKLAMDIEMDFRDLDRPVSISW